MRYGVHKALDKVAICPQLNCFVFFLIFSLQCFMVLLAVTKLYYILQGVNVLFDTPHYWLGV